MGQYPTEKELRDLKKLGHIKNKNYDERIFLEELENLWNMEYGHLEISFLKSGRFKKLVLITGGWSGNEDVLQVIQTSMFWMQYWHSSERGGKYIFRF